MITKTKATFWLLCRVIVRNHNLLQLQDSAIEVGNYPRTNLEATAVVAIVGTFESILEDFEVGLDFHSGMLGSVNSRELHAFDHEFQLKTAIADRGILDCVQEAIKRLSTTCVTSFKMVSSLILSGLQVPEIKAPNKIFLFICH